MFASRRGGCCCHEHLLLLWHNLPAQTPELCPLLPLWTVWILLSQKDTLPDTCLGGLATVTGDTPKGFRLHLSPGPGFSDKQVLTQSCLSLTCPCPLSPAAHSQWGFADCTFSWSGPLSLPGGPTRAPSRESRPPLKQT